MLETGTFFYGRICPPPSALPLQDTTTPSHRFRSASLQTAYSCSFGDQQRGDSKFQGNKLKSLATEFTYGDFETEKKSKKNQGIPLSKLPIVAQQQVVSSGSLYPKLALRLIRKNIYLKDAIYYSNNTKNNINKVSSSPIQNSQLQKQQQQSGNNNKHDIHSINSKLKQHSTQPIYLKQKSNYSSSPASTQHSKKREILFIQPNENYQQEYSENRLETMEKYDNNDRKLVKNNLNPPNSTTNANNEEFTRDFSKMISITQPEEILKSSDKDNRLLRSTPRSAIARMLKHSSRTQSSPENIKDQLLESYQPFPQIQTKEILIFNSPTLEPRVNQMNFYHHHNQQPLQETAINIQNPLSQSTQYSTMNTTRNWTARETLGNWRTHRGNSAVTKMTARKSFCGENLLEIVGDSKEDEKKLNQLSQNNQQQNGQQSHENNQIPFPFLVGGVNNITQKKCLNKKLFKNKKQQRQNVKETSRPQSIQSGAWEIDNLCEDLNEFI